MDTKLSLFKSLNSYESRAVGLDEIMRLIMYDQDVSDKTHLYRQIARNVSRDKAREVKEQRMPAFSVGVLFNGCGRKAEHVSQATGLALCDMDHIERSRMEDVKKRVCQDPHTLICYETISGEGLRIIYRYERTSDDGQPAHLNCEAYPAAWLKGNDHYAQLTSSDYDRACSDFSRLSGLAHDPAAYFHPDAAPFIITDEEMLRESLANGPAEPGRPRKSYEQGSQHASPQNAWTHVQRMLSRKGLSYSTGHRHDFMVHAVYLFNRFGASEEELRQWAAQEWGDMLAAERESVISHCYAHSDGFGTWKLKLTEPGHRRNALLSTTEIRQWLDERSELIYNVVTDMKLFRLKTPDGNAEFSVVDDRVLETMRCQMETDTGKRVLTKDVKSVVTSDFSRLVHPVRDYMEGLPEWDGTDRVAELAGHLVAVPMEKGISIEEMHDTFGWALHKWLVAMVATWMSDHDANHQILTLIGPQGIYKTTFFRHLLPPQLRSYFWENAHNSFSSKDDKLSVSENCLVEIEEVDAITGRDLSELKALVTADWIKERRPYAEFRQQKARLASFCATGNQQQFLTDLTGNRRWLCFFISHIDNPRQWQLDYAQLYAQLLQEYRSGFQYWFDKQEEQRIDRLNAPFRIISPEEELIAHRLRKPRGNEAVKLMSSTMIAMYLTGGHLSPSISVRKIGDLMRKLGYKWIHRRNGDYYRVVEIPWQETQYYLAQNETTDSSEPQQSDIEQLELPF